MRPFPHTSEFKQRRFLATHVDRKWLFTLLNPDFKQIFGQIVAIKVETLRNTNLVASR